MTPMMLWALIVCISPTCGPIPADPAGRDHLVLSALPTPAPARKCDTKVYGNSGCHLYHQKAIGNGWIEIVP
jgi:hypothetical protein